MPFTDILCTSMYNSTFRLNNNSNNNNNNNDNTYIFYP